MKLKKYYLSYRGEFEAEIEAKNIGEAIEKFQKNYGEIRCCGELWQEYFEIYEGDKCIKEMGD